MEKIDIALEFSLSSSRIGIYLLRLFLQIGSIFAIIADMK